MKCNDKCYDDVVYDGVIYGNVCVCDVDIVMSGDDGEHDDDVRASVSAS